MDRFYIGRKIIDLLSRKMLITSIALFNWMSPRSGTVDYQVALTYAGTTLRRNGRPPTAQSGNSMMSCPSYPAESSTTVFAVRFKKQKQYTFLSSLDDAIAFRSSSESRIGGKESIGSRKRRNQGMNKNGALSSTSKPHHPIVLY